MPRNRNTDTNGRPFAQTTFGSVWGKGRVVDGYDAIVWRRDICGKSMRFSDYGIATSDHGWEVDHSHPVAKGGTDLLANLQPLQWENNRSKGDTYPWNC